MIQAALQPHPGLRRACRIRPLADEGEGLRSHQIALLLGAGALAAVAVAMIVPGMRIPGSAILRAALPIVGGVALVPRRLSGSIIGIGAAIAGSALVTSGVGTLQPAAWTALLTLGPAIDLAMAGEPRGWRVYLRFALAGTLANSLAFVIRWGVAWLALESAGPHTLSNRGIGVFLSFAACGALAGLLSAAVCFRPGTGGE
jgi:hypothetical protein